MTTRSRLVFCERSSSGRATLSISVSTRCHLPAGSRAIPGVDGPTTGTNRDRRETRARRSHRHHLHHTTDHAGFRQPPGHLGNQRRNILAYWGTSEAPSCLKVRLIYDGYDLSTGAIWTQQNEHRRIGNLNLFSGVSGACHSHDNAISRQNVQIKRRPRARKLPRYSNHHRERHKAVLMWMVNARSSSNRRAGSSALRCQLAS